MSLPTRRPCITYDIQRGGERYHVSVGISPVNARPCEVFAYGPRVGSEGWALLQDVSVQISKQLQEGYSPQALAEKQIRDREGVPQSMLGVLTDCVVRCEKELRS